VEDIRIACFTALGLLISLDPDLLAIVRLSLSVSFSAVGLAALLGLPLGAAIAVWRFPGQPVVCIVLNALMGLPPVVVGLVVYLLLSRAGPLGSLGLLFTPSAMVMAQCLLVTPIIAAFTRQTVADLYEEYAEQLHSLGVGPGRALWTLLWDGRFSLLTALLAGFGRASAEVGAVIMVGGQYPSGDACGDDHDCAGNEPGQSPSGAGAWYDSDAARVGRERCGYAHTGHSQASVWLERTRCRFYPWQCMLYATKLGANAC